MFSTRIKRRSVLKKQKIDDKEVGGGRGAASLTALVKLMKQIHT